MPQMLKVEIYDDAAAATKAGRVYREGYTALVFHTAVIVRQGTIEGGSTVDLILEDAEGKQYAAIITGKLLKTIPC